MNPRIHPAGDGCGSRAGHSGRPIRGFAASGEPRAAPPALPHAQLRSTTFRSEGEGRVGSYVFLAYDRACGVTGTIIGSDGGIGVR